MGLGCSCCSMLWEPSHCLGVKPVFLNLPQVHSQNFQDNMAISMNSESGNPHVGRTRKFVCGAVK